MHSVNQALYKCWNKMESGQADAPKEWAKTKQQFQDATAVLQAIVTGTGAALDWEAKKMKAFAIKRLATLCEVGHGKAMKTWVVPLPEDPASTPRSPSTSAWRWASASC